MQVRLEHGGLSDDSSGASQGSIIRTASHEISYSPSTFAFPVWDSGAQTNAVGNRYSLFLLPAVTFAGTSDFQTYVDVCAAQGLRPMVTGQTHWSGHPGDNSNGAGGAPQYCQPYGCLQGPENWSSGFEQLLADTGWEDVVTFSWNDGEYKTHGPDHNIGTGGGIMNSIGGSADGWDSTTNSVVENGWGTPLHPVCGRERSRFIDATGSCIQ